tara:strand:- start:260 stop:2020 length:1761 start_codon:yes stop_codon:yes gene_type:complete
VEDSKKQSELNPPELDHNDEDFESPSRKGFLGCLCILLVLVCSGWWLWTGWLSNWFSQQSAKEAVDAYELGAFEKAGDKLEKLLTLVPRAPDTLRATGKLLQDSDPFRAFLAMKHLKDTSEAEPDDLRLYARLAQDVRKAHLAREVVNDLLQKEPENPDSLFLVARELSLAFRRDAALVKIREILAVSPTHRPSRLLQAQLLTFQPQLLNRIRGKTQLLEIASEEKDRLGLEALLLLAEGAEDLINSEEREGAWRQVEFHPLSTPAQRLQALGIRLGQKRLNKKELAGVVIQFEEWPVELSQWLADRNYFEEALRLFDLEKARAKPSLFNAWFRVLLNPSASLSVGDKGLAADLLVEAEAHLDKTTYLLFKGLVAFRHGPRSKAEAYCQQALAAAQQEIEGKRNVALETVAFQTLAMRMPALALESTRYRFAEGLGDEDSYGACQTYFIANLANKRSRDALSVAEGIVERFPSEWAARNNMLYLQLVLQVKTEEAIKGAEELSAQALLLPGFRTTLALARLRAGKPKEALDAITVKGVAPIYKQDADKAILAAVLHANGMHEAARELAVGVNRGNLLPEEIALLGE